MMTLLKKKPDYTDLARAWDFARSLHHHHHQNPAHKACGLERSRQTPENESSSSSAWSTNHDYRGSSGCFLTIIVSTVAKLFLPRCCEPSSPPFSWRPTSSPGSCSRWWRAPPLWKGERWADCSLTHFLPGFRTWWGQVVAAGHAITWNEFIFDLVSNSRRLRCCCCSLLFTNASIISISSSRKSEVTSSKKVHISQAAVKLFLKAGFVVINGILFSSSWISATVWTAVKRRHIAIKPLHDFTAVVMEQLTLL